MNFDERKHEAVHQKIHDLVQVALDVFPCAVGKLSKKSQLRTVKKMNSPRLRLVKKECVLYALRNGDYKKSVSPGRERWKNRH